MIKENISLINRLFLLTTLVIFGFFLITTLQMHFDYPFADQVDSYNLSFDLLNNNLKLESFLAPHNEHRPYISRLITFFSATKAGGTSLVELMIIIGILAAIYIAGCSMLMAIEGGGDKILGFFIFSLLVFNPAGAINWYWPYMIEMPIALFFVLVAFIKAAKRQLVLPSLLFILAFCSQAIGLFGSLALSLSYFVAYFVWRQNLKFAIFWFAFFIATFVVYMQGIPLGERSIDIVNTIKYTAVFVGKVPYSLFNYPNNSMWGYPRVNSIEFTLGLMFVGSYFYTLYLSIRTGFNESKISYHACVLFVFIASLILSMSRGSAASEGPSHANTQPTYLLASFFYIGIYLIVSDLPKIAISKYLLRLGIVLLPFSIVTRYESMNVINEVIQFKRSLTLEYTSPIRKDSNLIVYPSPEIGYNFIIKYCEIFPRCQNNN